MDLSTFAGTEFPPIFPLLLLRRRWRGRRQLGRQCRRPRHPLPTSGPRPWRLTSAGGLEGFALLCQLRLHPPPGAPRSVPSGLPCTAGSGQDHLETFNFTAWFLSTSLQRISYTSIKYPLFFPLFPVITTIEYIEVKTINIPKCVILKRKTLFHFWWMRQFSNDCLVVSSLQSNQYFSPLSPLIHVT